MYSILDLLEADSIETKLVASKNGGEYASSCPGCGGKDRFRSWPSRGNGGRWWCRQCGKRGDLIQYLREFRGMSFRQSCSFLGQDSGVFCNRFHLGTTAGEWEPEKTSPPPERWRINAIAFLKVAGQQLRAPSNKRIRNWLKGRGLKEKAVKESRLGWNQRDIYCDRAEWGLKEQSGSSRIWIPAGLVIPCFRDGVIQKVRIRRSNPEDLEVPPEKGGRYILVSGSSAKVPMVLGDERKYFIIVESDLDAILLSQETGDIASAISMGSATNKPDRKTTKLLMRAETILVALDRDEPGMKSAWTWWVDQFPKAKRWPVPRGKDPGEAFKAKVDLRKWVCAGLPDDVICLEDLAVPFEGCGQ